MPTSLMIRIVQDLRRNVGSGPTDGQLLDAFIARKDEAAFEALVRRYGSMVMGVCRRILRNPHDAEDTFQASFLVLVRKAASIRSKELVGNWLYGVARQTALRAKVAAGKRRTKERQVTDFSEPETARADSWHEMILLLGHELSCLPEKYRVPIVFSDLGGKTYKEAAQHLNCPEGTLSARLARARVMLAKRLARQGLLVVGGPLATVLSQNTASARLSGLLVASTIKAASLIAAGQAATDAMISAQVVALTEGVLQSMLLTKLKIAMGAALAVTVCLAGSMIAGELLP